MTDKQKTDEVGTFPAATCSLLPCPFCGGGAENLEEDYTNLTTSQLGIDRQSGYVICHNCGCEGPFVTAKGPETNRLQEMVLYAWNTRSANAKADRMTATPDA